MRRVLDKGISERSEKLYHRGRMIVKVKEVQDHSLQTDTVRDQSKFQDPRTDRIVGRAMEIMHVRCLPDDRACDA